MQTPPTPTPPSPRPRALVAAAACSLAAASAAAQSAAPRIEGLIRDSVRGVPLSFATVIATPVAAARDTVFHSAISDAEGRFALVGLASGHYRLSVEHPRIDSTGIGAPDVDVDVPAGGSVSAALGIPSVKTLRRSLCPVALEDTTVGIMLGTVQRTDGALVPNARVVFSWRDFEIDRGTVSVRSRQLHASVPTDAHGVYRACGLPLERPLYVQAQLDAGGQSGVLQETIGETGVLLRHFRLAPAGTVPERPVAATRASPASTAATADSMPARSDVASRRFLFAGRVHRVDGSALRNATVNLLGTGRTTTSGNEGDFRFGDVPPGTYGIEVLAIGYFPRYLRFEVGQEQRPLGVQMEKVAVVLDSMRVIARRQRSARAVIYREFESRVHTKVGSYMSENDIANKDPVRTSDLFRNVPGVRVESSPTGGVFIVSARGRVNFDGPPCTLDIFLDGRKMNVDEVNAVAPGDLHGVEIHTVATLPAQYRASQCGAVLLWTK